MRAFPLTLLTLCVTASLAAQGGAVHVTLAARGGLVHSTPLRQDFGEFVPGLESSYRLDNGRSVGALLEFGSTRSPLGVRLELNRTSSRMLEREPGSGGAPIHGTAFGRVTTATIALLLEPRQTCLGRVCPRLLVGGGLKRYQFEATVLEGDIITPFADDQDQTTLQLGIGVRATVSGIVLMAELSDFSNGFEFGNPTYPGRRTHDTFLSLGIGIRIPGGS